MWRDVQVGRRVWLVFAKFLCSTATIASFNTEDLFVDIQRWFSRVMRRQDATIQHHVIPIFPRFISEGEGGIELRHTRALPCCCFRRNAFSLGAL